MQLARILAISIALALTAALVACGDDDNSAATGSPSASAGTPTPAPASVTFMAGFKPQANLPFVGAYVAKEKGFFAEENLDVDIQHVTTPGDNFRLLAAGQVQFSTADAQEVLKSRVQDPPLPIVSLALIGQTGQQGFAVLKNSGINSPKDWAGKRTGYKGSEVTPDYLALLEANGVTRSSVEEVRIGFDPQVLTEGTVDIFPVFLSNEPDTLRRLGYDTTVFTAADSGAPTLGLTYVTTTDYLSANADVAQRFIRAALKGIQYANSHREEAVQIVLKYAPQEDAAHQAYMLDTELGMATSGLATGQAIGCQTKARWQALQDYLVKYNAIAAALPNITDAFTDRFVACQRASSSASP